MTRRSRRAICAALLVALAAVTGPVASASAARVPDVRGVHLGLLNESTSPGPAELDAAREVGANTVRVALIWSAVEPTAKGRYQPGVLAKLDDLMSGAAARGMRVLPVLYGSPCWASSNPAGCTAESSAWPPRNPADYADFAAFVARRYPGTLAAIEVWNEPDHINEYYWKGPNKPQTYAALVKGTYPVVKAADPGLPVLAGSIVGANGRFLEALYAEGIKGSYDGLSIHYYDLVLAAIRAIEPSRKAAGDTTPLWATEFGWDSCAPLKEQGGQICVTPERAKTNLEDVFRAFSTSRKIAGATVYTLRDDPVYSFGILNQAGAHKPSWNALTGAFAGRLGPPRAPKLKIGRKGGRPVASGTVPAGDTVEIIAYLRGKVHYKIELVPDRNRRYSVRLPRFVSRGNWRVVARTPFTGRKTSRRVG